MMRWVIKFAPVASLGGVGLAQPSRGPQAVDLLEHRPPRR